MSFMSVHLKNDLADVAYQIEETVDNIMEGFANTNYFIFDDLRNFKKDGIETSE